MSGLEWQEFARWEGLLWLAGSLLGYLCFIGFQPYRWAFGESYRLLRRESYLWMGVGLFGVARVTWATGRGLWRDETGPEEFLSVGAVGYAPMARDLAGPAFDRMLEGLLRMGTVLVDAWPLSVVVAFLLLVNGGGCLMALARSEKGNFTVLRVMAAVIVGLAALWHLGAAVLRVAPEVLEGGPLWLRAALMRGGGLFPVMTGFGMLVWVLWWMGRASAGWKTPPRSREAMGRAGSLVWWPVIIWVVLEAWRTYAGEWGMISRNLWVIGAIVVSWLYLVALVLYATGKEPMRMCLAKGQFLWGVGHGERLIWWALMTGLHVFLVEACGVSADAVLDADAVTGYAWGVFFPLLRAAVYVWLLGALVRLVLETRESG